VTESACPRRPHDPAYRAFGGAGSALAKCRPVMKAEPLDPPNRRPLVPKSVGATGFRADSRFRRGPGADYSQRTIEARNRRSGMAGRCRRGVLV